jgi:dihydroorotate dehydrogenase electron transfer subunit
VLRNTRESKGITSIFFYDEECARARPGQFVMVWTPGFDEMPMSLSSYNSRGIAAITVKPWGPGSEDLARIKNGALIGIRGPYGSSYALEKGPSLLVGSGTGLAPLLPLAQDLVSTGAKLSLIMGGKTKDDLLFVSRSRRMVKSSNLFIVTGDGSAGVKGEPVEQTKRLLERRKVNKIYACGSETMMRRLYEVCVSRNIRFEASLEREMKCAIGLCGSCSIGPYLLCKDGPVLTKETLSEVLDEFGILRRDASGKYIRERP